MIAVAVLTGPATVYAFDETGRKEVSFKPQFEWENEAPATMARVFPNVIDAMWSDGGPGYRSLWIEVRPLDKTNWIKAGGSFCLTLRGLGKPRYIRVRISFWRGNEIIATVSCN